MVGASSKREPGRILVVDDDPFMRESLERTLAADGHVVQTAANGREGLILFEKDKFGLVILDYEMPDVKGDELALVIKALSPRQPLIMISAYPEALATNLLTEVDMVIGKPFNAQALRAAATKLLQNP